MSKLSELKKVIQKAVPEIMELKLGCEVEIGTITSVFESEGKYGYALIPYSTRWDGMNGEATAKRYSKERLGKILGRPIRLSDVLVAIMGKPEKPQMAGFWADVIINWKLSDDNLDHQSEACINFLHNLLCQN